jgi:phospholipase/carboxylesterase
MEKDSHARGTCSIYVPESYSGDRAWPVVVALHGGYSHGRDFLWTWIREAKSRKFILLSPSSAGTTWSILEPDLDLSILAEHMEKAAHAFNIDRTKILLTGFSDGGTYTLAAAMRDLKLFTAFAPVSCTLPPLDMTPIRGKRVFWIHGHLDWMFSADRSEREASILKKAGALIEFLRIEDLSHTYPREKNGTILTWFDPELALE